MNDNKKLFLMIFLTLLMSLSFVLPAFALSSNVTETSTELGAYYYAKGFAMSVANFAALSSETLATQRAMLPLAAEISLSNIEIDYEYINLNIALTLGDRIVDLSTRGRLYASGWTEMGINSIIVNIPEKVNGYEFLLFEIHNDYTLPVFNMFRSSIANDYTLNSKPHVRLYLKSYYGAIYLFELELPEIFSQLDAFKLPMVDGGGIDWFFGLVEETIEVSSATPEHLTKLGLDTLNLTPLSIDSTDMPYTVVDKFGLLNTPPDTLTLPPALVEPFGLGEVSTFHDHIYTLDRFLVGDHVRTYSIPILQFSYENIIGNVTWTASFHVANATFVNGRLLNHGFMDIQYRNVRLQFAAGEQTRFLRTQYAGRMGRVGSSIVVNSGAVASTLFRNTVGLIPIVGEPIQSTLNLFRASVSVPNSTITLGGEGTILHNLNTFSAGRQLTEHRFYRDTIHDSRGHYFDLQAVVARHGAPQNPIISWGAIQMQYCAFHIIGTAPEPPTTWFNSHGITVVFPYVVW